MSYALVIMIFKKPMILNFCFAIACVLCGVIAAFSMPSASFWPFIFIGLSGLYFLYSKTSNAICAFACGFFFAIGYFVTGLWWIGNALLVEGNEFAWVWPISVIGLPTLLGLFTATYLGIARMIKSPDTIGGFFIFAIFLTFSEWARGHAFTGFPWNLYGYVWSDHLPMAQSFYYFGAYGFTFITILWASMAGFLLASKAQFKTKAGLTCAALVSLCLVYCLGEARLDNNQTTYNRDNGIVVVQPNIAQNMKWDPAATQDNFEKTIELSSNLKFSDGAPKNIILVWPETAISPTIYTQTQNIDKIKTMLESYAPSNAYLVTGMLRRKQMDNGETSYSNSIVLLNKSFSSIDVYDKFHLVPFGEFIPFQDYIPLTPVAAFKGFERGSGLATIQRNSIPAFSPLVCYEIIFPSNVALSGDKRPQWIVNSTNDGWYGDSAGPHQHFAQTRLRAIEEGLPVIRSANTGISGVIDPYGRIITTANIFERTALTSLLPTHIQNPPPLLPKLFQIILLIFVVCLMFGKIFLGKSRLVSKV